MVGYCTNPVALVIEYVEGGSLKSLLDKLDESKTMKIIRGIVAGMLIFPSFE